MVSCGMADKHPPLLRTQVEIAAACGVSGRKIVAATGVSRATQDRWLKAGGAERQNTYVRSWEKRNPEAKRRMYRAWRISNPQVASRWRKNASKWPCSEAESLMIKYRYEDARRLTEETGIAHEVDHIWPVSKGGPHLPWNLQVLTKEQNRTKGAKL